MFTTNHLQLRAFQDSDLDPLLALQNDADVQRAETLRPVVPRPPKYKDFLCNLAEDSALWFTIERQREYSVLGHCMVRIPEYKNRDGEFSLSIGQRFWGKGYEEEVAIFTVGHAFHALGLQRMSVSVLEGNAAARKLYAKIGFQEEGRKRRGNWAEGRWEDIVYMGILEEEWTALHNTASNQKLKS